MGRILGLLCLALLGLSLASHTQILNELEPSALNASPQVTFTFRTFGSFPSSDWSTSFWAYLNEEIESVAVMSNPYIVISWMGTTESIYFVTHFLPSLTTPTTITNKWIHFLIGSSTNTGYFVVTARESSGNFHHLIPAISVGSSTEMQLLIGACGGFSPVMVN